MATNLNTLAIATDGDPRPLGRNNFHAPEADVTVYFRDLETELIRQIESAQAVIGCVAWLTSEPILSALANVPNGVSIVVQKEDFLRPDVGASGLWRSTLRRLYGRVPSRLIRNNLPGLVGQLSYCGDFGMDAIRCVGNHNKHKTPAFPRMHNKFIALCNIDTNEYGDVSRLRPYAVWTGSFNFTKNAAMSLENAVVISNDWIAQAYYHEWEQILALSEPLDWESEWSAPEWRIGS